MVLQFNLQEENRDSPIVYLIGSEMLEDILKPYGQGLDERLEGKVPVTYLDINSADGAQVTDLYEIAEEKLPAIIILENDETFYKAWYGQDLPSSEAVAFEVEQIIGSLEA
jgi:hypothetical protein